MLQGILPHSGATGWQLPEEEESIASPQPDPQHPTGRAGPHPALTNTGLTRPRVAPRAGNRLYSPHGSHPAPPGLGTAVWGCRGCFCPALRGEWWARGWQQDQTCGTHNLSRTLSLKRGPAAQSHSERPFWAVPAFRRVLQSAALKTFVQGLWPAQHRAKVRGGGGRDVHLPELAAPERTHTLGQQADAGAQQHQGTPGNATARQPQGDKCVGKHQRQAMPQPALPRQPSPSSSAGRDAAPAKASPATCKLPAQLPLVE